ncbi:RNA polymerase sigma-70 factor (ECF subfamily) [Actinoalloteichus hymeniacidonis]|uniref:RNA polymerase sigma-70 factor, TIGR02957 family n=1 Tax=Actinoalloteichus hymeniacidonis TaxID=340345 RepID=A0AAC9HLV7_9PSEU|nr:RNA polymerase sigma-70 factor, TIGR02957 family [Actinoalloteichus hymeniacidonis]MBB5910301.1 RNA polymerase sigma-70 factor (ECF subfamily) [Actinoalloteichus hymeniacidonis]
MTEVRRQSTTATFMSHRNLLFTVAYEMLGSVADAEDVLQEVWLRWVAVDVDSVREPRAYLIRATTRQSLTRLRTLRRRRESYVGPWLPEPLLTTPDVAEEIELADSVSTAMLLVLETLNPTERAVFVLREVFALPYVEIGRAVCKTSMAVRQIAHRARAHVAARRPRGVVSAAHAREVLTAFRTALETGDLQGLLDVISPDVVLLTDGGGVVGASRTPVTGVDRVAGLLRVLGAELEFQLAAVNGSPAFVVRRAGEIDTILSVLVQEGLITGLYAVRNPEKLVRLDRENSVSR